MKKIKIAFDADGCLIRRELHYDFPNYPVINLLKLLSQLKNVEIIVWSGGGKEYAEYWGRQLEINPYVKEYASKLQPISPDITIDDSPFMRLGKINLTS